MGQQYSAAVEGPTPGTAGAATPLLVPASGEGKPRVDTRESARVPVAPVWRNNVSGTTGGSQPPPAKSDSSPSQGEANKLNRKAEEMNRMSIRAAIDTFIENCLSASNELSQTGEERPNDGPASNLAGDGPGSEQRNGEDAPGTSRTDGGKDSSSTSSSSTCESSKNSNDKHKHVMIDDDDDDGDNDDKELVIDYEEKGSRENEGKGENKEMNDKSPGSEEKQVLSTDSKTESAAVASDTKGEKTPDNNKKESTTSSTLSAASSEKVSKSSPGGEKQSFSAYLQDRLTKVDFDKHEELVQLANNKDIQSHGQMLMWEMAKKPVPISDTAGPTRGPGSSTSFTGGPVRLQTLIDKVLDNSLNNQDLRPSPNFTKRKREAGNSSDKSEQDSKSPPAKEAEGPRDSSNSAPDASPKTKEDPPQGAAPVVSGPTANVAPAATETENAATSAKPAKSTLCFKDHIEKVLLESFLSYEEEERKEALKNVNKESPGKTEPSKAATESDAERPNLSAKKDSGSKVGSDGTISVQDIVDRVISQTEVISKLMSPSSAPSPASSSADLGKTASSESAASGGTLPSSLLPSSSSSSSSSSSWSSQPGMKYQSLHSKALQEAQRQTVQKEHQSITNFGRKRGRPRLGSPMNNAGSWPGEGPKDAKYHDSRGGREPPSGQLPYGHHPSEPPRSGVSSSHGHPRGGQIPPPLDYAPHGSIQFGIPMGLPSLVTSQGTAPPASALYHQRHPLSRPQPEAAAKGSYSQPAQDAAFHHRASQHLSNSGQPGRVQQQQQQQHPGHSQGGKPPPPLILAEQIKESISGAAGSRLVPVSHIPTKSCSCHNCIAHFAREKSPSRSPHLTPHQLRQAAGKPERPSDAASHSSHYHPYQTSPSSRRNYPQALAVSSETGLPGQGLPPQSVLAGYSVGQQRPRPEASPSNREVPPSRYSDPKGRNPSPGHYPPYQGQPPPAVSKPGALDVRYHEQERHPPRHSLITERVLYEAEAARRQMPRDKIHSQAGLEAPKMAVASLAHAPAIPQDADQPLDLSVKPSPAHSKDTRKPTTYEQRSDLSRRDPSYSESRQTYRRSSGEVTSRGPGQSEAGQYVEYEQRGVGGHHLLRLENSVDRFLPQGQLAPPPQQQQQQQQQQPPHLTAFHPSHPHHHPHHQQQHQQQQHHHTFQQQPPPPPQPQHHHQHQQQPQQQQQLHSSKPSALPPPSSQGRGDYRSAPPPSLPTTAATSQPDHYHHPSQQQRLESPGQRPHPSHHPSPSQPSGYLHHVTSTPTAQLPQVPPTHQPLTPSQPTRNVIPSPASVSQLQSSRSPGPGAIQRASPHPQPYPSPHPGAAPSPAAYQRPPSHGQEPETRTTPGLTLPAASPSPHPHNAPSPDEQNGSRLNVSKHEPIQNIIGNHPPSDILYLICRLCRQTYGSPYGFRKHFRNQHGFEPKAEHTIVQTISATKTAMAHTGPLDPADKSLISQSPKDEKLFYDEAYLQSQGLKTESGVPTSTLPTTEASQDGNIKSEMKTEVKKEMAEDTRFLECPECGQTFQLNDFGSYKRHCRQHSLQRTSGPFACHDCQRSFAEPSQLQEHLVTHNNFTPSVCGICRTFFSSPSYLAGHLQAAHGHVYSSEGNEKISANSQAENSDNIKRSSDEPSQKSPSENAPRDPAREQGNDLSASTSSSKKAELSSGLPSSTSSNTQSSTSLGSRSVSPSMASSSSPKNHTLPISKRHRHNLAAADSQMFTVHTPKGLEVQKLPADAVVTTASPDSSYDEAKLRQDAQPASSSQKTTASSADTPTPSGNDVIRESGTGSDLAGSEGKGGNVIINLPKQTELSSRSGSGHKDDTESNSSDRCASVESNSLSVEGSRATSPTTEEADMFYKHKKYSRHRKRVSSCDVNEPETKSAKLDGVNSSQYQDQSPYSVSSTANSGITIRDCESSCLHSDDSKDSTSSSVKGKSEDGKSEEKSGSRRGGLRKDDPVESRSRRSDNSDDGRSNDGKKSGDGGLKFKWDRQTRSQAGKTTQPVSYTS